VFASNESIMMLYNNDNGNNDEEIMEDVITNITKAMCTCIH